MAIIFSYRMFRSPGNLLAIFRYMMELEIPYFIFLFFFQLSIVHGYFFG